MLYLSGNKLGHLPGAIRCILKLKKQGTFVKTDIAGEQRYYFNDTKI